MDFGSVGSASVDLRVNLAKLPGDLSQAREQVARQAAGVEQAAAGAARGLEGLSQQARTLLPAVEAARAAGDNLTRFLHDLGQAVPQSSGALAELAQHFALLAQGATGTASSLAPAARALAEVAVSSRDAAAGSATAAAGMKMEGEAALGLAAHFERLTEQQGRASPRALPIRVAPAPSAADSEVVETRRPSPPPRSALVEPVPVTVVQDVRPPPEILGRVASRPAGDAPAATESTVLGSVPPVGADLAAIEAARSRAKALAETRAGAEGLTRAETELGTAEIRLTAIGAEATRETRASASALAEATTRTEALARTKTGLTAPTARVPETAPIPQAVEVERLTVRAATEVVERPPAPAIGGGNTAAGAEAAAHAAATLGTAELASAEAVRAWGLSLTEAQGKAEGLTRVKGELVGTEQRFVTVEASATRETLAWAAALGEAFTRVEALTRAKAGLTGAFPRAAEPAGVEDRPRWYPGPPTPPAPIPPSPPPRRPDPPSGADAAAARLDVELERSTTRQEAFLRSLQATGAGATEVSAAMQRAAAIFATYDEAVVVSEGDTRRLQVIQQLLARDLADIRAALAANASALRQETQEAAALASAQQRVGQAMAGVVPESERFRRSLAGIGGDASVTFAALERAGAAFRAYEADVQGSEGRTEALTAATVRLRASLASAAETARVSARAQAEGGVSQGVESQFGAVGTIGVGSAIGGVAAGAIIGLIQSGKELAQVTVEDVSQFQALQTRLTELTGSAASAGAAYGALLHSSLATGSSLTGSIEAFSRLSLSTKQYGLTVNDNARITDVLNRITAGSGVSAEEASRAYVQLAQAISKGRAEAQDLKSIQEQAPSITQMLQAEAEKQGTSLATLQATTGVTGKFIIQTLEDAASGAIGHIGELPDNTERAMERVKTAFFDLTGVLAKEDAFGPLNEAINRFAQTLEDPAVKTAVEELGAEMKSAFGFVLAAIPRIAAFFNSLPALTKDMALLGPGPALVGAAVDAGKGAVGSVVGAGKAAYQAVFGGGPETTPAAPPSGGGDDPQQALADALKERTALQKNAERALYDGDRDLSKRLEDQEKDVERRIEVLSGRVAAAGAKVGAAATTPPQQQAEGTSAAAEAGAAPSEEVARKALDEAVATQKSLQDRVTAALAQGDQSLVKTLGAQQSTAERRVEELKARLAVIADDAKRPVAGTPSDPASVPGASLPVGQQPFSAIKNPVTAADAREVEALKKKFDLEGEYAEQVAKVTALKDKGAISEKEAGLFLAGALRTEQARLETLGKQKEVEALVAKGHSRPDAEALVNQGHQVNAGLEREAAIRKEIAGLSDLRKVAPQGERAQIGQVILQKQQELARVEQQRSDAAANARASFLGAAGAVEKYGEELDKIARAARPNAEGRLDLRPQDVPLAKAAAGKRLAEGLVAESGKDTQGQPERARDEAAIGVLLAAETTQVGARAQLEEKIAQLKGRVGELDKADLDKLEAQNATIEASLAKSEAKLSRLKAGVGGDIQGSIDDAREAAQASVPSLTKEEAASAHGPEYEVRRDVQREQAGDSAAAYEFERQRQAALKETQTAEEAYGQTVALADARRKAGIITEQQYTRVVTGALTPLQAYREEMDRIAAVEANVDGAVEAGTMTLEERRRKLTQLQAEQGRAAAGQRSSESRDLYDRGEAGSGTPFGEQVLGGAQAGGDDIIAQYGNSAKDAGELTKSFFEGTADAMTQFVMTGKADLASLGISLEQMALKMTIQLLLARALSAAFGAIGGGGGGSANFQATGSTGAAYGAAHGMAMEGGDRVPMATGGILSRETMIPMAHGGWADAGEQPGNTEAVMPLKRNSRGDLGVQTDGGGGGGAAPSITINNHGEPVGQSDTKWDPDTRTLEVTIRKMVDGNIASGAHNRAMKSAFGLTPNVRR